LLCSSGSRNILKRRSGQSRFHPVSQHIYIYICTVLEIILDLPCGFPINNIISLYICTRTQVRIHICRDFVHLDSSGPPGVSSQPLGAHRVPHVQFVGLCVCMRRSGYNPSWVYLEPKTGGEVRISGFITKEKKTKNRKLLPESKLEKTHDNTLISPS